MVKLQALFAAKWNSNPLDFSRALPLTVASPYVTVIEDCRRKISRPEMNGNREPKP